MKKWKIAVLISAMTLGTALLLAGCGSSGGEAGASKRQGPSAATSAPGPGSKIAPGDTGFTEYPIGEEKQAEGLNVALVYFQPVPMEPATKAGLKPTEADIHLEADITALKNNSLGFGLGEFVPDLQIRYSIENTATGNKQQGSLMPMNASDGPHYGANIKLGGAGNYKIELNIKAPDNFLLHIDKETGVEGRWWSQPLRLGWDFQYIPRQW